MVDPVDKQQKVNPFAVPPEDGLSDKSKWRIISCTSQEMRKMVTIGM
jgi:hypothetical protein